MSARVAKKKSPRPKKSSRKKAPKKTAATRKSTKKPAKKKVTKRQVSKKRPVRKKPAKSAKKKAGKKKIAKKKVVKKTKATKSRTAKKKASARKPPAKKTTKKTTKAKATKAAPTKKATPVPKKLKLPPPIGRPAKRRTPMSAGLPAARRSAAELRKFKTLLQKKHGELLQAYVATKVDSRDRQSDGTEDYIDYAVSSYDREFLLSLSELEQKELRRVDEALDRIKRPNDFGNCMNCGQGIPDKRLEVQPWARYCVRCQELEELGLLTDELEDSDEDEAASPSVAAAEAEAPVDFADELEPEGDDGAGGNV